MGIISYEAYMKQEGLTAHNGIIISQFTKPREHHQVAKAAEINRLADGKEKPIYPAKFKDNPLVSSDTLNIAFTDPNQKRTLDAILIASENGIPVEDLIKLYTDDGHLPNTAIGRVAGDIGFLRHAGCVIENITPVDEKLKGIQPVYAFHGIRKEASPPPEATTQSVTKATPKDETTIKKEEIMEKLENSTAYLLSKIVEGTIHLEVFGRSADYKSKRILIIGFSEVLEKYWNQDPESIEDISEVGKQITEKLIILKRRNYIRREIIQSVCSRLGIFPPKRYKYN